MGSCTHSAKVQRCTLKLKLVNNWKTFADQLSQKRDSLQINETEVEYAGKPLCIKGFLEQLSHHFPDLMEIVSFGPWFLLLFTGVFKPLQNFRKIINAAESQDPFAAITAIHDYFDWSVLASETGGLSTAATHAPLALAKLLKQHSSPY